ncbi:MAG: MBL fold metallo-hydrolase [Treponemataceae bacterium]|nr:MBL fold metallo-hydrolase [Treponemataceae bacterium]
MINLTDAISYLPASTEPFSCDIGFIKGPDCTWVFDVGVGENAAKAINSLQGPKKILLSHFHPDHIGNLPFVTYDELYVSSNTKKYTKCGSIIEKATDFDGIRILPMPSSHAKGCLVLVAGDYAFLGDGAFCMYKGSDHLYNVQLLASMIAFLESLDCRYFCLSHEQNFVQHKATVLAIYREIYERRHNLEKGNYLINVNDYF